MGYCHRKVCKKMKVNIQLVKKAELASTGEKKNPKRQTKPNKTKQRSKNLFSLDSKEQKMVNVKGDVENFWTADCSPGQSYFSESLHAQSLVKIMDMDNSISIL